MAKKGMNVEEAITLINEKCDEGKAKSTLTKGQIDAVKDFVRTSKEMMPERVIQLSGSLVDYLQKGVADNLLATEMPEVFGGKAKVEKLMDTKEGKKIEKEEKKAEEKTKKAVDESKYKIKTENAFRCTTNDNKFSRRCKMVGKHEIVDDYYVSDNGIIISSMEDGEMVKFDTNILKDGEKVGSHSEKRGIIEDSFTVDDKKYKEYFWNASDGSLANDISLGNDVVSYSKNIGPDNTVEKEFYCISGKPSIEFKQGVYKLDRKAVSNEEAWAEYPELKDKTFAEVFNTNPIVKEYRKARENVEIEQIPISDDVKQEMLEILEQRGANKPPIELESGIDWEGYYDELF